MNLIHTSENFRKWKFQKVGFRNRKSDYFRLGFPTFFSDLKNTTLYPRPTRKCCVLLRPGHWATLPTQGTPEVADRSLSRLCFLMHKFSKNERRACDHRVWLLEWPQAPLVDLTAKSGAPANLKFSDFQVESTGFLGLRARLTWRSNQPGELAATWEARIGDRKIVFRFSKIYALKNTAY